MVACCLRQFQLGTANTVPVLQDRKRQAILLESKEISQAVSSAAAAHKAHKAQHGRQQGQGGQTTKRPVAAPTSVASGPSGEINRHDLLESGCGPYMIPCRVISWGTQKLQHCR